MKTKKITAVLFILVLALQLLPIKQAMQYFFNDNPLVEELVATGKAASKNIKAFDEDYHSLINAHKLALQFDITNTKRVFHFDETIPSFYTAEILTPPPNKG